MRSLIHRLWADDLGGIVSAEYLMVMGVVTGGAISAAVGVRNAVTSGFARVGHTIEAVAPDPDVIARQLAVPAGPAATAVAVVRLADSYPSP